jgi:predicted Fe-Mo cluster-binding NifX family protein
MDSLRLAIPSNQPGGLYSDVADHFGHCDLYTLVDVAGGEVTGVSLLENVPHQQGGCMAPVNHLAGNKVNALIAGGMGMRPLMGFSQVGIKVYHRGEYASVSRAVEAFLAGDLAMFSPESTCGGTQCG